MKLSNPQAAGFTMIELSIAFGIVAVLAAVAVPIYKDYTLNAKLSEVVMSFSPLKAQIVSATQIQKSMPQTLMGIQLDNTHAVSGRATDIIEGFRYGGEVANDKYWFVARLKDGVLPGNSLATQKREIHYGIYKTAAGKWKYRCGSWSSSYIDTKYLPSGCQVSSVKTAIGSSTN